MQATVENLVLLVSMAEKTLGRDNFMWSVVGAGKQQMLLGAAALAMGGNVRVGLEDSIWLGKGRKAKSNAEQVEKIIRIAKEMSKEIAKPDEAREILGTKGLSSVKF
ncbi:MAG: 3-keto-5-aminohexanoate cleavage protein [Lachnospiraceae bacterium]